MGKKEQKRVTEYFPIFYGGYSCVCLLFPFGVLILLPAMSACTYSAFPAQVLPGAVGAKRKKPPKTKNQKQLIYLSIYSGSLSANGNRRQAIHSHF